MSRGRLGQQRQDDADDGEAQEQDAVDEAGGRGAYSTSSRLPSAPSARPISGVVAFASPARRGLRSTSVAAIAVIAAPVAPLHGARDEQHRHVRREQEQHHGHGLDAQRDRQHRPSTDVVGQAADHEERGEQEHHVDGEDRRQRRGREAPLRLVDDVKRAGDARGGQEEHDDPGHRGEEPAAADGVEAVSGCRHSRRNTRVVGSMSGRSGRGTAHAGAGGCWPG